MKIGDLVVYNNEYGILADIVGESIGFVYGGDGKIHMIRREQIKVIEANFREFIQDFNQITQGVLAT
jgi:hypothetical protein